MPTASPRKPFGSSYWNVTRLPVSSGVTRFGPFTARGYRTPRARRREPGLDSARGSLRRAARLPAPRGVPAARAGALGAPHRGPRPAARPAPLPSGGHVLGRRDPRAGGSRGRVREGRRRSLLRVPVADDAPRAGGDAVVPRGGRVRGSEHVRVGRARPSRDEGAPPAPSPRAVAGLDDHAQPLARAGTVVRPVRGQRAAAARDRGAPSALVP